MGSRCPFKINNLIFIVKDGSIPNFVDIIDLNFIILQFEFLKKKIDFEIFVILMKNLFCNIGGKSDLLVLAEKCDFTVLVKTIFVREERFIV